MQTKPRGIVYSTVSLLLISGLIALMVSVVNYLTAPAIKAAGQQKIKDSIGLVFSDCLDFAEITQECRENGFLDGIDGIKAVYRVQSGNGGEDGYCVVSVTGGYGGEVEMLSGFTGDGLISGVRVLSADGETPGVGQRIKENRFLWGFGGLKCSAPAAVDGVSGATVSSSAAVRAVNNACTVMQNILGLSPETADEEVPG